MTIQQILGSHLFVIQVTIYQFRHFFQLNKAADLLLHTDFDVRENSEQTGYPIMGYFSDVSKLKFGV